MDPSIQVVNIFLKLLQLYIKYFNNYTFNFLIILNNNVLYVLIIFNHLFIINEDHQSLFIILSLQQKIFLVFNKYNLIHYHLKVFFKQ